VVPRRDTHCLNVRARSGPSQQARTSGHLPQNAAITIACETAGSDSAIVSAGRVTIRHIIDSFVHFV
jgi:hypothetical protein